MLARLRGVLEKWIKDTGDQGRTMESDEVVRNHGATKPGASPRSAPPKTSKPPRNISIAPGPELVDEVDRTTHEVEPAKQS